MTQLKRFTNKVVVSIGCGTVRGRVLRFTHAA
jgi:hypothetical protein